MPPGRKKGHLVSPETRLKIRLSLLGKPGRNTGNKHSPETKQKMRLAKLGIKHSKEWNEKIRLRSLGNKSNTGKTLSLEVRKKISEANSGEKAYQWKGGISKNRAYLYSYTRLHRIRRKKAPGHHSLKEWLDLKDKYKNICVCCTKKEPEIKLTRDHVIPLTRGGSDDIENIQPLCASCNSKKRTKCIDYRINM